MGLSRRGVAVELFTPETSVMLLIDHQVGTLGFCPNIPESAFAKRARARFEAIIAQLDEMSA